MRIRKSWVCFPSTRGCVIVARMIHAIVMAGGKGTRFWPLSRSVKAKQFLSIVGDDTLLNQTLNRVNAVADRTWIVGNVVHHDFFCDIPVELTPHQVLYEPVGRNTAPCIGWAAIEVLRQDPDAIMVVLPSDHAIADNHRFVGLIQKAIQVVKSEDCLVTLGIHPRFPHTGFGYIESGQIWDGIGNVVRFREKPNYETAVRFLEQGCFYWNAGIFVWKASTILSLIKQNIPQDAIIYDGIQQCQPGDPKIADLFTTLQSISIDFAVMEYATARTRVIPADMGWDDIGNWSSLDAHWPVDQNGNASRSTVLAVNSRHNIVSTTGKPVALVDVDHLVVVETEDAIMVIPRSSDQKIRELYDLLPPELR